MIKLSKRLEAIASFVRRDAKIVDIGCDHAYLDIYLVERNPNIKAIALDLREGALKQARSNIIKYHMENVIDVRLSNGLDKINKDEVDTIIISGMGTQTIIDIITIGREKLTNVSDLIIQPNNDYYNLRKSICSLGYKITNEKLAKDKGKIYLIMNFKRGIVKYSQDDYMFGPILRKNKDSLYKEWLSLDLEKKEILFHLIPRKYLIKRFKLKTSISKIKQEIK